MTRFIEVDTEDYEFGHCLLNVEKIRKISFEWHTLDDDNLFFGDEADRCYYAERTGQNLEDVNEWIKSYFITFDDNKEVRTFLIDGKHFKNETELKTYLNNL